MDFKSTKNPFSKDNALQAAILLKIIRKIDLCPSKCNTLQTSEAIAKFTPFKLLIPIENCHLCLVNLNNI